MHKVYDLLLVWYFLSIPIYISSFAATQCYLYNFFLFKIYEGSTIFQNILDEGGSCVAWKVGTRLILSFYCYTIYLFDFNKILATCFSINKKKHCILPQCTFCYIFFSYECVEEDCDDH